MGVANITGLLSYPGHITNHVACRVICHCNQVFSFPEKLTAQLLVLPSVEVNRTETSHRVRQVIAAFRSGGFNTLVSTCVGEEGLDIGDVDLIVCYDVSKSPISLVSWWSSVCSVGIFTVHVALFTVPMRL